MTLNIGWRTFLGVDVLADENFNTKKYLKFCQNFAKDVVLPAEDKKEEVMFMNRSVDYFAKNDDFEETAFLNSVIDNPALIPGIQELQNRKSSKIQDRRPYQFSYFKHGGNCSQEIDQEHDQSRHQHPDQNGLHQSRIC